MQSNSLVCMPCEAQPESWRESVFLPPPQFFEHIDPPGIAPHFDHVKQCCAWQFVHPCELLSTGGRQCDPARVRVRVPAPAHMPAEQSVQPLHFPHEHGTWLCGRWSCGRCVCG